MTQPRIALADINHVIMQFGQNLGLGNLSLDENGLLSLVFDEHLAVELQLAPETGVVFFIAPLSAMPDHQEKARILFQERMLQAPLTEGNLAGAFFCVDPESEEILLMRAIDARTLTTQSLENEMERFVNALDFWSARMEKGVLSFDADGKSAAERDAAEIAQGKGAVQI